MNQMSHTVKLVPAIFDQHVPVQQVHSTPYPKHRSSAYNLCHSSKCDCVPFVPRIAHTNLMAIYSE